MNTFIKIAIVLFGSNALFAMPVWFGAIKGQNSYEIIGFGEGVSLDEAKTNARADIAKQIKVKISSEIKIDKQSSNEKYTTNSSSSLSENVSVLLSEIKELKSEKENNIWFVALGYDNLSATTKLAKKLINEKCDKMPHVYLSNTVFYKNLASQSSAVNCVLPKYDNGVNYIGIGENRVVYNFDELLSSVSNGVTINPSKTHLKENESFFLEIEAKKGFVSIFNIHDGGKVTTLVPNMQIKNDKKFVFPEPKSDFELSSVISENEAIEGYFVINSAQKLDLSRFGVTGFGKISSTQNRFDEFIKLLEVNKFGSTIVNISK